MGNREISIYTQKNSPYTAIAEAAYKAPLNAGALPCCQQNGTTATNEQISQPVGT